MTVDEAREYQNYAKWKWNSLDYLLTCFKHVTE